MGNVISRCAQDVRNAWKTCSKKHAEEETMLSTCDSEPLDKCHEQLLDPSISGADTASRAGSPVSIRRPDDIATRRLLSVPSNPDIGFCCPENHQSPLSTIHDDLGSDLKRLSTLVDRESQTSFEVCDLTENSSQEKRVLSKAYIVKTYSLHNATPSPSPDAHSKFSPIHHSVRICQCQPFSDGSDVSITPLDSLEKRQEDVLKRLVELQSSVSRLSDKYSISVADKQADSPATTLSATTAAVATSPVTTAAASTSPATKVDISTSPATKVDVSTSPATKADVSISPPTTIGSSHGQAVPALSLGCRHLTPDLVISADPSSIPLSLIVLCQMLSDRHRALMSTFVHSSVSDSVPDKLRSLLTSNSGIKRGDCDLAITFIWKKVAAGLQLVVDPTKQTTIEGEANVARYLARLLNPSYDEADIITATQIDEILDLTQLQLLEGKSKEKAAAVRTLNSQLGKRNWLAGSEPSVADIVCWSALHQTNQTLNPPANVKKWLSLCGQHKLFQTVSSLIS